MKYSCFLAVLNLLLVGHRSVNSLSRGAPEDACNDMLPRHGGSTPQESSPPFSITPNTTNVYGGDRILLRLQPEGSGSFKGFLIQAKDSSEESKKIGAFFTATHQPISCGALNNAVTHNSNEEKNAVTLEWEGPSNYEGDIYFSATVVKAYNTYWTNLQSEKVSIKKRDVVSVVDSETPKQNEDDGPQTEAAKVTPKGIEKALNELYFGCGSIKTCFGTPPGCVDSTSCSTFTSFTKVDDDKYEFEVMGAASSGAGNRYAAVALSEDVDMGDDSVMVCASSSSNRVEVFNTWNDGKSNVPVVDRSLGLNLVESGFFEDKQYCRFHRDALTTFNAKMFDLNTERFHVLIASGSLNSRGELVYHGRPDRSATPQLVNLGFKSKLQEGAINFVNLHAALMIIAWIGTASCGILFARYFKQTWLGYKCLNLDQWFHMHRFFMVLTWGLTIAGLVLIVLEVKDFRLINHAYIGIASIALCFIQPFMAMCRPHPGTENRRIFNWAHWFVGNSAQILGIVAIFFGMDLKFGTENRHWIKEVMWYILVVFIAFHCLIHLILSFVKCISDRKASKPSDVFPLKDLSDSRVPLQGEKIREDAPLGGLRKFFLAIYLPINWIATALLVIAVIFSKEEIEGTLESWGIPAFWEELEAQRGR